MTTQTTAQMTALAHLIAARIAAGGPITLADYMAECLLHPTHGYYATRDPFGTGGDFTTAPEISQMFGELLGLCLAQVWLDQGAPGRIVLAELGPGRGTLMADALRATARVPGFHAALSVHLVEASAHLRQVQAATLAGHAPVWHDSIATLPDAPLYLMANEFFDALPIRQFRRVPEGWVEHLVGFAPHPNPPHKGEGAGSAGWDRMATLSGDGQSGTLFLGQSSPTNPPDLRPRLADTVPGDVVELCPALPAIVAELGTRIARHGGAALVVDYGGWRSLGDTFQALRQHRPVDPFAEPGLADLTAHVDFEAIARAASPAQCSAMVTQGALLAALGIAARAEKLAKSLQGAALTSHLAAFHRLTDPSEMGNLFKAIALYPEDAAVPAGFLPNDA
jgi:NADH dehydrogenase [ubiquinone] 1 alpha subcomplex assembly factor 7